MEEQSVIAGAGQPKIETGGCLNPLLLAGLLIWVVMVGIAALVTGWSVEQLLFEGSLPVSDSRWAAILFPGGLVALPALVLALAIRRQPYRAFFQAFTAAGIFLALMTPTRLLRVDDFQKVTGLQIVMMLVFLVFMLLWRVVGAAAAQKTTRSGQGWAAGLWLGLLAGFPFVALGALGSLLDTALAFAAALIFAMCAVGVSDMAGSALPETGEARNSLKSLLLLGAVDSFLLLLLCAGLAQNGNQILLAAVLPGIGFGIPFLNERFRLAGQKARLAGGVWVMLVVFWVLAAFDPDELMSVVGMTWQEPLGLAAITALISCGVILLQVLVLIIITRKPARPRTFPVGALLMSAVTFVLLAGVYLFVGQPGFYGEKLFVILANQTDVSDLAAIGDPHERRSAVFERLTQSAAENQQDLRAQLDRFGLDYQPFYLVNALEVRGGPVVRWWLEQRSDVDRVLVNPVLRPLPLSMQETTGTQSAPAAPEWNLTLIGADRVWNELGVSGEGIVVGQSDSGVQFDHPEFAERYRGVKMGDDYNWLDPWYGTQKPVDLGGHGTHTLGSILGKSVGVAPQAEWIACANLARNLGNPAYYLSCMQFMLAPYPQQGDPFEDGDPALGANVLNNSWGCPDVEGCDPNVFLTAMRALRTAGVFVVVSAGNSGYESCGSVSAPPAIYADVYTVGAVNANGVLAAFSSLGPVDVDGSSRTKPDIIAPGEGVLSAYPGNSYEFASGTSMAGPHVVGVVALMWSANPALMGDIETTTRILNETAAPYDQTIPECAAANPKNAVGSGRVDAYAAVKAAQAAGGID